MSKQAKKLLETPGGIPEILAHAQSLIQLEQRLASLLPNNLKHACRIANSRSGCIIIHADNGVVASKLRQIEVRLVEGLTQLSPDSNCIEIKVQPRSRHGSHPQAPHHTKKSISARTNQTLADMAKKLPHDSSLALAIQNLRKHAEK